MEFNFHASKLTVDLTIYLFTTMSICFDDDSTKGLMIDGNTYILRVQGYRYLAEKDSSQTVLKTYIEVLRFIGDMDVSKFTREGTELIGYLCKNSNVNNANPEFKNVPEFIAAYDKYCDEKRMVYSGESGFSFAQEVLEELKKEKIAKGIKHYLIRNYPRKIVLVLQMLNPAGKGFITIEQIETYSDKVPDFYNFNRDCYRLSLIADEYDKTTAYYTLSAISQQTNLKVYQGELKND